MALIESSQSNFISIMRLTQLVSRLGIELADLRDHLEGVEGFLDGVD